MAAFPHEVPVLSDSAEGLPPVVLRAHRSDDLAMIAEASNDNVAQAFLNLPNPYRPEHARDFVQMTADRWNDESSGYRSWAITLNGQYAGNVSVKRKPSNAVEIGYLLHPQARGEGVATRAVALALAHAADVWKPVMFHWRASVGNWASRAVAWKLGFTVDGIQPCAGLNAHGQPVDEWWGHRLIDAATAPAHPWWVPPVLTGDLVRLVPPESADPHWAEHMAAGRGIAWVVEHNGHRCGLVSVNAQDGVPLSGSATLILDVFEHFPQAAVAQALDLLLAHAYAPRTDEHGQNGLGLQRLVTSVENESGPNAQVLHSAGFRPWGAVLDRLR